MSGSKRVSHSVGRRQGAGRYVPLELAIQRNKHPVTPFSITPPHVSTRTFNVIVGSTNDANNSMGTYFTHDLGSS
jgi:hypothetical protein